MIEERLQRSGSCEMPVPVMRHCNIDFEVSDRFRAINCGGIGTVHLLVQKLGLASAINSSVHVLQRHLPYHESDHVLNIAYNILCGGSCIEDLEVQRQNLPLLDALNVKRLPDPTTAGDFTRRFKPEDILHLMEAINLGRQRAWQLHQAQIGHQPGQMLFGEAVLDVDGTIAETLGECKEGIGLSYKGIWGYCPLAVTLANTREILYLLNRSGNAASQTNAPEWVDRAIALVRPHSDRVCLRGDSAFSLTGEFDRWSDQNTDFVFGVDAMACLKHRADNLPEAQWQELERLPKYEVRTTPRGRRPSVKEQIVEARGYKNVRLCGEQIAEFKYRPGKCNRAYRMIVLRKNLKVQKGQLLLYPEERYFFYVTNRTDLSAAEVVRFINGRCDQENLIAQMKHGVHALSMPMADLNSNWVYAVMASLAWNLKAWCGLLMPNRQLGCEILKLEFRAFLQRFIMTPCHILTTGRKIIYRTLAFNRWLGDWIALARWLRPRASPC